MEEFIEIVVDNQTMCVRPNIPLLQALKASNIFVPAMCYHSKVEPYGGCGLCLVEICIHGVWRVQHACLALTEAGCQIRTRSERILRLRARAVRMLLKRGPFNNLEPERLLRSLISEAETQGITPPGKSKLTEPGETSSHLLNPGCILCGLCVRMCWMIGKNQLVFLGRGKNLRVGMVDNEADICSGCKACRQVCPTGFIKHNLKPTPLYV